MSTDPFVHDDAAYVLGALSPDRRRAFEEHLAECAACTRAVNDLAGVPGLLSRLDESDFAGADALPPVPDTLLPQLVRRVRRQRLRARLVAAAAVAAAVVAAVLVLALASLEGAGDGDRPEATTVPAREMTQVDQDRLTAAVAMEQVAWGTRISLTCTYRGDDWGADAAPSYALLVRTRDGDTQQVATWRAVPGRTTELTAAAAAERDDVARVDVVVTGTSRRVLTLSPAAS